MPTISVEQSVLQALMAEAGHVHDVASLEERLPLLGTDIDLATKPPSTSKFSRPPDLLPETLARHARSRRSGEPRLHVEPATTTMTVDDEWPTFAQSSSVRRFSVILATTKWRKMRPFVA